MASEADPGARWSHAGRVHSTRPAPACRTT